MLFRLNEKLVFNNKTQTSSNPSAVKRVTFQIVLIYLDQCSLIDPRTLRCVLRRERHAVKNTPRESLQKRNESIAGLAASGSTGAAVSLMFRTECFPERRFQVRPDSGDQAHRVTTENRD